MLNFNSNYILENEAVRLSPLQVNDYDHLLNFATNEPEIWEYSLVQPNSQIKLKKYINDALLARKKKLEYAFIVYDKIAKQYAGSTRFYDIQVENKSLQLGYTWYGKQYRGTLLNKNCKYLLLAFAFDTLQVDRVEFRADNKNKRSISAMLSIGCVVEGVMRDHILKPNGGRRDSIVLSILRHEWASKINSELHLKIN